MNAWERRADEADDVCTCDHTRIWHSVNGLRCEFHCSNPERCCWCSGYAKAALLSGSDV